MRRGKWLGLHTCRAPLGRKAGPGVGPPRGTVARNAAVGHKVEET